MSLAYIYSNITLYIIQTVVDGLRHFKYNKLVVALFLR